MKFHSRINDSYYEMRKELFAEINNLYPFKYVYNDKTISEGMDRFKWYIREIRKWQKICDAYDYEDD